MKRVLFIAFAVVLLFGCPKKDPATGTGATSVPGATSSDPPPPKAPADPENRVKLFGAVSSTKSATGFGNERLFDGDLSTTFVSRPSSDGKPVSIEMILPNTDAGMCVKKIGMIGGTFGSAKLAEKVARPDKMKITLSLISEKKPSGGGKSKAPPVGTKSAGKSSFEVSLPASSAPEIQWFDAIPETCKVVRVVVTVESNDPPDITDTAIAELYVVAE
jgi:hypothetical protein